MDRDRWPDAIATFVDGVTCPRCSAPRAMVMVTVRFQNPVWNVISNCMSCRFVHVWQHIGNLEPKPKPTPDAEPAPTPLPAWARDLEKELG